MVGHKSLSTGHKSLSTKRLVVESLSDIETSNFKALLTYHFLIPFKTACAVRHIERIQRAHAKVNHKCGALAQNSIIVLASVLFLYGI